MLMVCCTTAKVHGNNAQHSILIPGYIRACIYFTQPCEDLQKHDTLVDALADNFNFLFFGLVPRT